MKLENSLRLSYRLLDENDGQLLFDLDQEPEVMRFINGGTPSSWGDITTKAIPRLMSYRDDAKGWGLWGVFIQESNQFIGWVLVRPMGFFSDDPQYNDLELGWRFCSSSWGKGYATEAAEHISHHLTRTNQLTHFSAIALEDNIGSINIMKKLGMTFLKKEWLKDEILGEAELVFYQKTV